MGESRKPKRLPKEVALMVGGGQKLLAITAALVDAILDVPGATFRTVDRLSKPEGEPTIRQMAAFAVNPMLQVAWSLVLPWIIAACRFSWVYEDITAEHFPLLPDDLKIKSVEVVRSGAVRNTSDVLKWLDEQGLRPATLMELFFWWLTNPDVQQSYLVIALGQTWNGFVACVNSRNYVRRLDLSEVAGVWHVGCHFAAVAKEDKAA